MSKGQVAPIAVLGAGGHMGIPYVKALLTLQFDKAEIIGIEPDAERRQAVEALGVPVFASLADAAALGIESAIVSVPSPLHRKMFELCASLGIKNVFSEKPLVLNEAEFAGLDTLGLDIYTGYLIHFSPAVDYLCAFVEEKSLECAQVISMWGKNWCAVGRPMGPDLEEELIHPLVTAMRIIGRDKIVEIKRSGVIGTYVPYVRPEVAEKGKTEDFGFPERLNDTSLGNFNASTAARQSIPISILSSFNFARQRRTMDVTLMEEGETFPRYKAILDFDLRSAGGGVYDEVSIIDALTDQVVSDHGGPKQGQFVGNKVLIQLEMALKAFAGEEPDPRLVNISWAGSIVRLLEGALA